MRHTANYTSGVRVTSEGRQVTVGRDPTLWNLRHERLYFLAEFIIRTGHTRTLDRLQVVREAIQPNLLFPSLRSHTYLP